MKTGIDDFSNANQIIKESWHMRHDDGLETRKPTVEVCHIQEIGEHSSFNIRGTSLA